MTTKKSHRHIAITSGPDVDDILRSLSTAYGGDTTIMVNFRVDDSKCELAKLCLSIVEFGYEDRGSRIIFVGCEHNGKRYRCHYDIYSHDGWVEPID